MSNGLRCLPDEPVSQAGHALTPEISRASRPLPSCPRDFFVPPSHFRALPAARIVADGVFGVHSGLLRYHYRQAA